MTVSSLSNRITYAGNGSTTTFPFAFKVAAAADLTVIFTDATGTDHTISPGQYGVSGLGLDAGGSVTYPLPESPYASPVASGTLLTLLRDPAPLQPAQLANQGALWPAVIEAALDRLTWIAQRLGDGQRRSLAVAPSESGALNLLPPAPQRANSLLGFDNAGQPYAAQLVTGLASVSSWLLANFLGMASRAAALGALGGAGTADDNAMTGTSDFTAGRIKVPTRAAADSGTDAASTAMVQGAIQAALLQAGGTIAATGSYTFANGLIAKWGTSGSIAASSNATITFAAAFPTALFGVVLTPLAGSTGWTSNHAAASFRINNGSGAGAAFFWLALGN